MRLQEKITYCNEELMQMPLDIFKGYYYGDEDNCVCCPDSWASDFPGFPRTLLMWGYGVHLITSAEGARVILVKLEKDAHGIRRWVQVKDISEMSQASISLLNEKIYKILGNMACTWNVENPLGRAMHDTLWRIAGEGEERCNTILRI